MNLPYTLLACIVDKKLVFSNCSTNEITSVPPAKTLWSIKSPGPEHDPSCTENVIFTDVYGKEIVLYW